MIGEMPGALNFRVQSIKITSDLSHWKSVFVRIKYGNEKYKTPPTMVKNTLGEYIWFVLCQPPLLRPPLSPTQEPSGKLGDENNPQTEDFLGSDGPDWPVQVVEISFRGRRSLGEPVIAPQPVHR